MTLNALGQYQEALQYLQEALVLRKDLLGKKHPDVAENLCRIGEITEMIEKNK